MSSDSGSISQEILMKAAIPAVAGPEPLAERNGAWSMNIIERLFSREEVC